jgi:oxygen-dependent protoporphyrinogen oxidase
VRVLEASDRLGGQIWSEYSDGFLVERGAEGFVARSELVPKLVSSWPNALPVFSDAHRGAVQAIEAALPAHQVLLAGSAFHGAGIDAAVRSAERAAASLLAQQNVSG